MSPFDLAETSPPSSVSKWLPSIGGLVAAGIVAYSVCRLPPVHTLSLGEVLGSAVADVLAVFTATAVTVAGLHVVLTGATANGWRSSLRTSFSALWFAPLALLIRENSLWAMAVSALLVISVAKSFRLLQSGRESGEPLVSGSKFSLLESSPWFWRQLYTAGAALCAQTGIVAGFAEYPLLAALLVGVSCAVWVLSSITDVAPNRQTSGASQAMPRSLLAATMALVLTAGCLIPYLPNTAWFGGFGVPSRHHSYHLLTQVSQRGQPGSEKTTEGGDFRGQKGDKRAFEDSTGPTKDANSGIVLWPKEPTPTTLVAPSPAMGNSPLAGDRSAKPLIIPFGGVYWFYKAPDQRPPVTSREAHGSPELLDIHSTDRRPLSMEAHEHFGSTIDLDCCSKIQVAIRNADTYPETVALELILINSSLPGKPSQSLGKMVVKSTPSWKLYEGRSTTSETLTFPIPANHSLRAFDEVMIVFRLNAFRADDGARIAIDRFVLVPRGM